MKRVVILGSPFKEGAAEAIERERDWLAERVGLVGEDLTAKMDLAPLEADLAVVFGGDGTMLSAARRLAPLGVPAVGVNLGRLGLLAEVDPEDFRPKMERVLKGDVALTERMMLSATLSGDGADKSFTGLNDFVVSQQSRSPMLHTDISVGGQVIASFRGDGLIVSTPTGSTAYNLSAGGPILSTKINGIILTPICPHTLSLRPLVIGGDEVVDIQLHDPGMTASLVIDGTIIEPFSHGQTARIAKGPHAFKLVTFPECDHYCVIRDKLHWGRQPAVGDR